MFEEFCARLLHQHARTIPGPPPSRSPSLQPGLSRPPCKASTWDLLPLSHAGAGPPPFKEAVVEGRLPKLPLPQHAARLCRHLGKRTRRRAQPCVNLGKRASPPPGATPPPSLAAEVHTHGRRAGPVLAGQAAPRQGRCQVRPGRAGLPPWQRQAAPRPTFERAGRLRGHKGRKGRVVAHHTHTDHHRRRRGLLLRAGWRCARGSESRSCRAAPSSGVTWNARTGSVSTCSHGGPQGRESGRAARHASKEAGREHACSRQAGGDKSTSVP